MLKRKRRERPHSRLEKGLRRNPIRYKREANFTQAPKIIAIANNPRSKHRYDEQYHPSHASEALFPQITETQTRQPIREVQKLPIAAQWSKGQ